MRDETIIKNIGGVKVECRVRVPYISSGHIDFIAEDDKVTWISETGYMSYFFCLEEKLEHLSSEELVKIAIKNIMKEKGITEQQVSQVQISAY